MTWSSMRSNSARRSRPEFEIAVVVSPSPRFPRAPAGTRHASMSTQETIAVLGAGGTMGRPMARNLARSGVSVRAWNRSAEKARELAGEGIELCPSPADATAGASVILTMLSDAGAVLEVMDGHD